jgi:glucan phosphoethanolaminetransferase (alkaline phosphatase superfamily)
VAILLCEVPAPAAPRGIVIQDRNARMQQAWLRTQFAGDRLFLKMRLFFSLLLIAATGVMTIASCLFWQASWLDATILFAITSFCLIYADFKFKAFPHVVMHAILALMLIADMHLIALYHYDFGRIGKQIFLVTQDVNIHEAFAYWSLLSYRELTAVILLCIGAFFSCYYTVPKPAKLLQATSIFLLFVFGYPQNFIRPMRAHYSDKTSCAETLGENERFSFQAVAGNNSPQLVVLLIGESHRHDYFAQAFAGYRNNFKNLLFFDDMVSHYPTTMLALPGILTRRAADDKTLFFKEKSLFALFKEAGYETYYVSYLSKHHKGDDRINFILKDSEFVYRSKDFATKPDPTNSVRYGGFRRFLEAAPNDADILPALASIMAKNDRKKLVVIKMVGLHFPAEDRYPDKWDVKQPSLKRGSLPARKENAAVFFNTYENGMGYSAFVINQIAEKIRDYDKSALFTFVSDHGFCIFEAGYYNAGNSSHGFHIPLIMYGNESYHAQNTPAKWNHLATFTNAPVSQSYLFETLASLSSIDFNNRNPLLDMTVHERELLPKERFVYFMDGTRHSYEEERRKGN